MAKVAKRRGRYILDYYDNQGKRRWQTLPKGTTLKAAKKKLREIEEQLDKGVFIPIRNVPTIKRLLKIGWNTKSRTCAPAPIGCIAVMLIIIFLW